jgi:hypothetical protein
MKTTKNADKPSKIQRTRNQGQQKRVRKTQPTQQTPDGRRMRQEEGQDRKIGHATQGKTAKNDGKHNGRNISRTTGINIIQHNNAYIITNNIPSIITVNITNQVKRNITNTNKKNKQARKSRRKPTRQQHTHATNRTSIDSSGIGFIPKYEAGPQDKTSDDNTHGKKRESGKVHLEETRNNTAWNNQLKGFVTRTRYRRHGIRNRKSADKQLITHFLWTRETAFSTASDRDAHLKESTSIFVIRKVKSCKTKQDSNTRPRKNGQGTQQTQKGEEERRLQKGKMVHPSTPTPRLNRLRKDSFETPLRQVLMYVWKAACNRFNKRKEKKEERIKREVRRMRGSLSNHQSSQPSSSSW